jgi:outer membrane protein assembly factor BamB
MVARAILAATLASLIAAGGSTGAAPNCREGAIVSAKTGKVLERFSAPRGLSQDVVADGHGGWFVVGPGLSHVLPSGRVDAAWRSRVRGRLAFGSLQLAGGRLFVSDRRHVIALDPKTGARLWTSPEFWGPHAGPLAVSRSVVYVGGQFKRVGRARRRSLAALEARTGHVLPWQAPSFTYPDSIGSLTTLALTPGRLYVGGWFASVGGKPRPSGVASLRLDTAALTSFNPRFSADDVSVIAPAGRVIFVGGTFGGGAFDAVSGRRLHGFNRVTGAGAITVAGSIAYLGGDLRSSIGGGNLLAIDVRTGKDLPWDPKLARYVSVGRIARSGSKVYVGGSFCSSIG